jgi:DNA-binding NarL/FixJ family response regulator
LRGATKNEIARTLMISRHTVKVHVKAVYAKLNVTSLAELSARPLNEHIGPALAGNKSREFDFFAPAS